MSPGPDPEYGHGRLHVPGAINWLAMDVDGDRYVNWYVTGIAQPMAATRYPWIPASSRAARDSRQDVLLWQRAATDTPGDGSGSCVAIS